MDIHKLYIFAKNRDAIAAQKGYSFQQLKTIKDWLENRISCWDQVIYCDYEDDIFARDFLKGQSSFKQIKLYSTDFSFSSESIKKSVAHFFMLYVKGDYAFDNVSFSFETNAAVVERTVKDNDAALLKEWYVNQENLREDLISRIRTRVKKILEEYVNERYKELSNYVELKGDVQKAKLIYEALKDEDFDAFIHCIKWQFDNIDQNKAVDQIVEDIQLLVMQVPLPLDPDRASIYPALLIAEVHSRSTQDNSEDRKLTNRLLDSILLGAGNGEDKWYADVVHHARDCSVVQHFFPGEFQQTVTAARYCRWKNLDDTHKAVWLKRLNKYISLKDAPVESKRKGIYEYIFLKIGHNYLEKRAESAIVEDVDVVKFFIGHWKERNHIKDIEQDITLLQVLKAQIKRYALPITKEYLKSWEKEIETFLDEEISKEQNTDQLCELLELRGHLEKQKDVLEPVKNVQAAFDIYRKILPFLEHTKFYSLSKLFSQMGTLQKMLIKHDFNEDLQDAIDEFMSEIQKHAVKTGQRTADAYSLVERAELHLKNRKLRSSLKALELFHQAKDLLRMDDTKGSYVVCLLGLSQVYNILGMNYAAKYYALVALWSTWHSSDPQLNKLLPKAIGLVNISDFMSGAWMHAIHDFDLYLFLQREFDEKGLDFQTDDLYLRTRHNIARIVHAVTYLYADMANGIQSLQEFWGMIWEQQIQPFIDEFNKVENPLADLNKLLNDAPLNDAGSIRTVLFNALNIDWIIELDNNATMNAIGEEFLSFLQVALCEIAGEDPDIVLPGQRVKISIEEGHFQKEFLGNGEWVLTIPSFDTNEEPVIRTHYAYLGSLVMAIFAKVTRLAKKELDDLYMYLLKEKKFGEKVLEGTAYQRAYKQSVDPSSLDLIRGFDFSGIPDNPLIVAQKKWLTT